MINIRTISFILTYWYKICLVVFISSFIVSFVGFHHLLFLFSPCIGTRVTIRDYQLLRLAVLPAALAAGEAEPSDFLVRSHASHGAAPGSLYAVACIVADSTESYHGIALSSADLGAAYEVCLAAAEGSGAGSAFEILEKSMFAHIDSYALFCTKIMVILLD